MNPFFTIVFAAIFGAVTLVSGQSYLNNPIVENMMADQLSSLRGARQEVIDNGCEINLCFAIDGSGSVTPAQFQRQKDFADLIINIITTDEPGNLASIQYETSVKAISLLTFQKNQFISKLHRAKQVGGLSNVDGALGYCGFQLRPRKEDANKVIIMGDGFYSIGFRPKLVANKVLDDAIDICAVAVGPSDVEGLIAITGDKNRFVRIKDFFDVGEIFFGVINEACGYY